MISSKNSTLSIGCFSTARANLSAAAENFFLSFVLPRHLCLKFFPTAEFVSTKSLQISSPKATFDQKRA
jgi:hypothetical protein